MINEKKVKELLEKREIAKVKIVNWKYIYSKKYDAMIPEAVAFDGDVWVYRDEEGQYFNLFKDYGCSECSIALDFVLENIVA